MLALGDILATISRAVLCAIIFIMHDVAMKHNSIMARILGDKIRIHSLKPNETFCGMPILCSFHKHSIVEQIDNRKYI